MDYYLAVLAFTFVAGVTPGPNNIMLFSSGVNHGVVKSLPHYFGICLGFPLLVAAIGFGLGTLFQQFPQIHLIIKMFGILYLLFLAWKIANSGNTNEESVISAPITFIQAAIFQWLNPKAWVIAIGAITTFTQPNNVTHSILWIIVAYFFMGLLAMGVWLFLGASLQSFLKDAKRNQYFNWLMAALLVISIFPMVMTAE